MLRAPLRAGKRLSLEAKDRILGFILILPIVLIILAVIAYPIVYNINLSFFRVALNPKKADVFIGLANYIKLFSDREFYMVLGTTLLFVVATVVCSTVTGLLVALLLNRKFKGRGLARSLILLSYVTPMISLVYVWIYMHNSIYGVVNYLCVDVLRIFSESPLWFDDWRFAFLNVLVFDTWRVFPYAFMMLLAALQAIDESLYEAGNIDGAGAWAKFRHITLPELMPVLATIATLRTIWNFYKFDDVYLLTKQLPLIGVYLYKTSFSSNNFGLAAAITVVLFVIIITLVILMRKVVFKDA